MLKLAALFVASAAAVAATGATATTSSNDTLVSSSPWWERVTVTLNGDGNAEACRYETSLGGKPESCDVDSSQASPPGPNSGGSGRA